MNMQFRNPGRKQVAFFILITALFLYACTTQQKIQYYELPADTAEEAKIEHVKKLEQGRVLYNLSCAKCHNKKVKGKTQIPDFTGEQLESYTIRIQNETHLRALSEQKLTAEELQSIQLFFTYKKPSSPVDPN